ncbi:glycosyltransferase [Amycolatopsis anabasis]|uniref:glycosyltransferase n=1 Tax=Amycolatopsis anabasis TaxID=1840409 RepID=UPI00131E67F3|nr:glycosyltransferase [Amycolatopsis anabasis]
MRILFTTAALSGHFFPLVPLAWACRTLGHDILIATTADFVPTALRSGLAVTACGPRADFTGFADNRSVTHSPAEQRYAHGRVFGRIAARNLADLTCLVDGWRPDLVVSERAEFAGPIVAAARELPGVELQWGVAELEEYRLGAGAELDPDLTRLGLDRLPDPVQVLNPWPPSLRLSHTVGHQSMRFVPYNGDARVPEWALGPRERPRICLTLGTLLPRLGVEGLPEVVLPILDSLARLDVELVVAVDDEVAEAWPPLPRAVRQAGRMPLSEVLTACDLAIHHGGQGTALTALEAGRPQLVLPQFDDQLDNADAVVKAGAGLRLASHEMNPPTVARCCRELLHASTFGDAAANIADEIAAQPSPAEIGHLLERLAG